MNDKKPAIRPETVEAFVGNAHGDLNAVRQLLANEPAPVNAAWDRGAGRIYFGAFFVAASTRAISSGVGS